MADERFVHIDASLRAASASNKELVLPADMALVAIQQYKESGVNGIAWEGWLIHDTGQKGHSLEHQGTNGFFDPEECAETIKDAAEKFNRSPERPATRLYFCLTPDLGERP